MECQTLCDRNELLVFRLKESERIKESLLPADAKLCPRNLQTIVGGHSVSGAAAFHALNNFTVSGYIGLDPIPIQRKKASRPVRGDYVLGRDLGSGHGSLSAIISMEQYHASRIILVLLVFALRMCRQRMSSGLRQSMQCHDQSQCRCGCGSVAETLCRGPAIKPSVLQSMFDSPNFRLDRTLYRIYPCDNIAKVLVDKQEL
jgi:hypothetical protein